MSLKQNTENFKCSLAMELESMDEKLSKYYYYCHYRCRKHIFDASLFPLNQLISLLSNDFWLKLAGIEKFKSYLLFINKLIPFGITADGWCEIKNKTLHDNHELKP
jgi:hypothetical protein